MEKIPSFGACHLATHPKSSTSRRICQQVLLLFVLETSQYPSGLRPEEVALLVGFNGKYPSTCYVILWFFLPQINEIENLFSSSELALAAGPCELAAGP